MPATPDDPNTPYDLAAAVAKLRSVGLESLLDTLGVGRRPSETTNLSPSQPQQPAPPVWLPGNLDFAGRDPWHPQYAGLTGQPSGEDRLITLHNGAGTPSNEMTLGSDGLYGPNPMTAALRQRREAGEDATRQAQSEEADAMVDEFSRSKARKDAAQDQEWAERSAQSAANFEAEMQARGAQRTKQRRGGLQRIGRGLRGRTKS